MTADWFAKNTTDAEKATLKRIRAGRPHVEAAHPPGPDAVLRDVTFFLKRFVAFTMAEQVTAVALWVVHAHAINAADTTARLAVQSAEKESGKTRLLEVLELLVPAPLSVANISPAALFRVIAEGPVTVLFDEVDAVFNPKANGSTEDLRALLNAGYRRGATVARVVGEGKKMTVQRFPVFAPVATAGIGALPDTVQSRAIPLRLKRRARGEEIEKLRRRLVEPEGARLRERIAEWVTEHIDVLAAALPDVPDELPDRAADIWEPLLAIADEAGGKWPARARAAAKRLSVPEPDDAGASQRVRLLADVHALFNPSAGVAIQRMSSADLVVALQQCEESPWGEWFTARKLAAMLRPVDVRPKVVRKDEHVFRGYLAADFADAFLRYLPTRDVGVDPTLEKSVTSVTTVTTQASADAGCNDVTAVTAISGVGEAVDTTEHEDRYPELFEAHDRARDRSAEAIE